MRGDNPAGQYRRTPVYCFDVDYRRVATIDARAPEVLDLEKASTSPNERLVSAFGRKRTLGWLAVLSSLRAKLVPVSSVCFPVHHLWIPCSTLQGIPS